MESSTTLKDGSLLSIRPLKEHPEAISELSEHLFKQWTSVWMTIGCADPVAVGRFLDAFSKSSSIPYMFVGLIDGKAVASACVEVCDWPGSPKTPWLTNVFVVPEKRGLGISKPLIKQVMKHTAAQGVEKMYLWTKREEVGLYETIGWEFLEEADFPTHDGSPYLCSVMHADITNLN